MRNRFGHFTLRTSYYRRVYDYSFVLRFWDHSDLLMYLCMCTGLIALRLKSNFYDLQWYAFLAVGKLMVQS